MHAGTVHIITLGCSKNLVDSEKLMAQFKAEGLQVTHHDSTIRKADVVVVNTCGFIGDAQEESVNTILECCSLKRAKKIGKLYVMGCLSEKYMKELAVEIPEVDKFYGKFNWNNLLADMKHDWHPELKNERIITTPSHYAFLKVAEGCDRRCAYCAIPLMTGPYKSSPQEEIVDEARKLVAKGVKEIQLIAQDITYYGLDHGSKPEIAGLVERISDIPGVEWIRLHYAYPNNFPTDLLRVMRERDNVCKYLDLALQHISDPILKRMNRHITAAETLELIGRIREEVPGINLRTTLMVGFPGETEEQFSELEEFVRKVRFERMGAFAYCEVDGTFSARHYKDNVPQEVKEERLSRLMSLQQDISLDINNNRVGRTYKTIIDRVEGDYYVGRTEFDSPEVDPEMLVKRDCELQTGSFYNIKVTQSEAFDLYGIPV